MRNFLRLITMMAAFGLVAACAETGDKMSMSGDGGFKMSSAMAAGQKRLMDALAQGGAEKSPKHTASAKKSFACWMDQTKAKQKKKASACQNDFYGSMALLEADVWASPKMAAPKMAAPKGPPRTKHFLVFFGLDSAIIAGNEAKAVVNAAKFIKSHKGSNVYVTGHTDQAGSTKYNMKLAKKRTDAVVSGLTDMGVKKSAIGAVAQGENDPAVSHPGMKDSRNRRVVISVIY